MTKTMKKMKGKRGKLYLKYRRLQKAAMIADAKMIDAYTEWVCSVNQENLRSRELR